MRAKGMLDENEYSQLHYWVKKTKGKAMICEINEDHSHKKYHWANVSRAYLFDPDDWISLCLPCHFYFDRRGIELDELVKRRGSEKVVLLLNNNQFRPPFIDKKRQLAENFIKNS